MNLKKMLYACMRRPKGKFAIRSKVPVSNKWELSLAYSRVAEPWQGHCPKSGGVLPLHQSRKYGGCGQ